MPIKKGVKKREHENLSHANIAKVIGLLEVTPPVTKKVACEILNIAYNTTRLSKIIEEYQNEVEEDRRRRAANRGKPLADYEIASIIEWTLDGDPVSEISKRLYRSSGSINRVIEEVGVPERSENYAVTALLPDQCVAETFEIGQLVWCVQQNKIGVILSTTDQQSSMGENIYNVWEFERIEEPSPWYPKFHAGYYAGRYATYVASALGSLTHLKPYGIDLQKTYSPFFPRALKIALGMEVK